MQGFFLGLSTGIYCFASCGLVLAPWLLAEAHGPGRNILFLLLFLGGRLLGYLFYGVLAWLVGWMFQATMPASQLFVFGCAYIVLSIMLVVYAIRKGQTSCHADAKSPSWLGRLRNRSNLLIPFVGGLITGLNVCYPFMLAFAAAAALPSLYDSVEFFMMFYLGTSIFILPLPLLGFLRRYQGLQKIGRLAAGLVGCYYLYYGIVIIVQGVATGASK